MIGRPVFRHYDHNNCRVYYRDSTRWLYCIQDEGRSGFRFYRCSQDGEPSHEVAAPFADLGAEYAARKSEAQS